MKENELVELIEKHNDLYYGGEGVISDSAYDTLQTMLYEINPNHKLLKQVDAHTKSSWKKAKHDIHMGSLFKIKTIKDFSEWFKKTNEQKCICQHKFDGLSISLQYKKGLFVKAITRGGDGIEGEDITNNVIKMDFPKSLKYSEDISVRGEILLSKTNFKKINDILEKNGDKLFSNPRNASSGIARNTNGNFAEYLNIKIYDCNKDFKEELIKIAFMEKIGFNIDFIIIQDVSQIDDMYKEYVESKRKELDYDIDGLVIKINDINFGKTLGIVDNRPKYQIALKFPDISYITTVNDIKWQVGRTGRITPVVMVEKTMIDNKAVRKASIHNNEQIKKLNLTIGSVVELKVSGDVIPQIVSVVDKGGLYDQIPTEIEGFKVVKKGQLLYVDGVTSQMLIKQITHYMVNLGIEGISEKTIESLYNEGTVKSIPDLYKVGYQQLLNIEGFAKKSSEQFVNKLHATLNCKKESFIVALGIDGLGNDNTRKLLEKYDDFDIYNIDKFDFGEVFNNPETVDKIMESYKSKIYMLKELQPLISFKESNGGLKGKSFCITGKLERKTREQYINIIKDKDGVYKLSVSKGLTYLVTNNPNSGSGKNKKAKDYGTEIITEEQLIELLGGINDEDETLW